MDGSWEVWKWLGHQAQSFLHFSLESQLMLMLHVWSSLIRTEVQI